MADPFTIAPSKIIKVGDPVDLTPPQTVRIAQKAPAAGVSTDAGEQPRMASDVDGAAGTLSMSPAGASGSGDAAGSIDPPDPLDPLVQDADITTPWFDPETQPVHQGVYQRRFPGGPYSCWDGTKWFGDAANAARAATTDAPSPHQDIGWRGLVSPSAAPCPTCRGHGVVDLGVHEDTGDDLMEPCEDC